MASPVRFGYTLVYVSDVAATLEFYTNAFGLQPGFLHPSGEYGELATGATKLGFVAHDTAAGHGFTYTPLKPGAEPPGLEIGLVVDDVQKAYDTALAAGCVAVKQPAEKPWGLVVSYVRDCNGLLVELFSAMKSWIGWHPRSEWVQSSCEPLGLHVSPEELSVCPNLRRCHVSSAFLAGRSVCLGLPLFFGQPLGWCRCDSVCALSRPDNGKCYQPSVTSAVHCWRSPPEQAPRTTHPPCSAARRRGSVSRRPHGAE